MKFRSQLLLLSALVLVAGVAAGQVTRGGIAGVVEDQDGAVLPGVTIEALNEDTGTRYTVVTGPDGRFSIANVRVGPYTVTAALEGFRTAETNDVQVTLGREASLAFSLQLDTVTEELTVVGESNPLMSRSRTGAASNVGLQQIEDLPTISRGLEDFARTNPFFSVASENEDPESISVAGRNSRYNNIQIDGAVNNDLFGLADQGTPGGQADTTPISLDAIQEVQLVLADFDVRQGGFSGGSVNAITRSGTNAIKGSVFYFTRDDGLVGDGPEQLGDFGTFDEEQYGFRIGGPISQNKAFYFVNGEITAKDEPTGWSIDGSSGQAFANGAAVDDANRFRDILIDSYGFDPGGLSQQNLETDSDKLFARVDFNLRDNHQLTVRHNFVDGENQINRPGSSTYEFPSEAYDFTSETNSTVAQLNSVLGPAMFNELRVTRQEIVDRRAGVGDPFPWVEIEQVGPGGDFEFEAGTEPFSTRNAVDQEIFELTNDFTWVRGNHTLTFGTHNEFFEFSNLFIQNAFGAYQFDDLDAFEAGIANEYDFTLVNPGQSDTQNFNVNQIGLYAGDQWAAKPNLTLTYGLRVDIPFFPDDPSRNPLTEDLYGLRTDTLPDGEQLWQPRVGFNWDIAGDGRQQLRGGAGIFAGRTPYVWISNNYARTGIEQTFIEVEGEVPFEPDPFNQPTEFDTGLSVGEFNLIDPDFEFPQVARFNLAYDRQLPWWDLVLSLEGIYGDSVEEIDYRDVNLQESGDVQPFDGRPIMEFLDPGVGGAFLITNTDEGEATNFAIKLERPYRGGLWGFVSYAYGESKVVNDGSSSRAVSNFQFNEVPGNPNASPVSHSDFEVRHRFNASLSYRFNADTNHPTTVSTYYNLQSGRPYSNIYGFQFFPTVNGDGYFSNDLMYVPSGPDDVVITNGTWEELDAYIRSDDCLDRNRGQIAPRNCSDAPWNHTLDLRIAQDIPIRGTHLQITADILNVLNLLDDDSGAVRFANFNAVDPVDFSGTDDQGRPIISLNQIVSDPENNPRFETHNLLSRWRAKLGIRWTF